MDRFTDAILRKHAETTKKHLEERHFGCTLVEDEKEALSLIQSMIKKGDTVSVGGSMTLFETGVIDYLEHNGFLRKRALSALLKNTKWNSCGFLCFSRGKRRENALFM